ncbi:hypothetical protein [Stieleria mannarensis]|uniref:hypothetical protein n=1 Tax=Stieleria mannarensis TaxID=2755585 RepID=UPI00160184DC|nr:hypothetical protein [Rhodopirellula sp. JC639]
MNRSQPIGFSFARSFEGQFTLHGFAINMRNPSVMAYDQRPLARGLLLLIHCFPFHLTHKKGRTMATEVSTFATMRADHRHWDHDHTNWLQDIAQWQQEHQQAVAQLKQMEELIRMHGEAVQNHAEVIEQHQCVERKHDQAMFGYVTGASNEHDEEAFAEEHARRARQHETQSQAHERIKKHHHTVMAQLSLLKQAMESGM